MRGPVQILRHPKVRCAIERLAQGDLTTAISADRRDEVGRIAGAVMMFKDHMLQLSAVQEQVHARAATEKHAALITMAEKIEVEANAAMAQVAQRTDAMAATANSMRESASRTEASAQHVASAAGQALANAQTVASAAEQLSGSIREIAGQVGCCTTSIARAVEVGGDARKSIEALNAQVGRIGAVADIIADIAAKTNLLRSIPKISRSIRCLAQCRATFTQLLPVIPTG
jgi:methyl-accepting chemotaxis protein